MRKRGKKRISQDDKPWVRISKYNEEGINLYNRMTSHWTSGNRRQINTSILTKIQNRDINFNFIQNYFLQDNKNTTHSIHQQLFRKYYSSKFLNNKKAKNFCLFLGRGRTYNRALFISRHALRKLTKTGLISGLTKK